VKCKAFGKDPGQIVKRDTEVIETFRVCQHKTVGTFIAAAKFEIGLASLVFLRSQLPDGRSPQQRGKHFVSQAGPLAEAILISSIILAT
jgi:hypothetical protein